MSALKSFFRGATFGASIAALTSCTTMPSGHESPVISEDRDYNTQRTRMVEQPMTCDITTYEEGTVNGGRTIYHQGRASRVCETQPQDEYSQGHPLRQIRDNVEVMNDTLYEVRSMVRTFENF